MRAGGDTSAVRCPDGRRRVRWLAVALAALALAHPAWAQAAPVVIPVDAEPGLERWGEAQGVPFAVTSLLRAADGYLWVGTGRGLVRFDGLHFDRVPLPGGPGEGPVRALLEDPGGTLWIASPHALLRLEDGRVGVVATSEHVITALRRARDGVLWVATERGLGLVEEGKVVPLGGEAPTLLTLAEDADGRLLAGGNGGLFTVRDDRLVAMPAGEGGTTRRVQALLTDRHGRTWVGTAEGLLRADPAGARGGARHGAGLVALSVNSVAEGADGRIWVATLAGGVQRLSEDGATAEPRAGGRAGRPLLVMLADQDGSLWGGTGSGLEQLHEPLVLSVTRADGLSGDVVWSVYTDPQDGALWVGLDGAGLDRLGAGRPESFERRWGLSATNVVSSLRTRDGTLWHSVRSRGLLRDRGARLEPVLDADGRPYGRVRGLRQIADGSVLVGTDGGLERHLDGRVTRLPISGGWPFRCLAEDAAGGVWAGGARVVRLEGPDLVERTPAGLEGARDAMYLEPDGGDLWIASYSRGLQLWHAGKLTTFGDVDRRFGAGAVAVLADGVGGLWVAQEGSLLRAPRSDLLAFAEGSPAPLRVLTLDERDGLASTEFSSAGQSPADRTPDGRLWFGTAGGLVVVEPARLAQLVAPAPPKVERAFLAGVEVPIQGGAVRLAHGDATLEVAFTSPTLVSPNRLLFRHRLLGFEAEWRSLGPVRTAVYRGLGEGDFRLELEVSRDGVDWVAARAPLVVEVRPGMLERTWVRLLLGLVAAAAVAVSLAGLQGLRGRQLKARAEELRRLVEARTAELGAARDELEARVEERTGQLQRELAERERLERTLADAQKLDSIGRLAGGVAHDLNNLLTVVLGCAATAQAPEATPAEVREDLGEIQKAGERAATLTRQLLAFARRQILTSKRLDLNEVVASVGTMLHRLLGAHLELVIAPASGPCPVLADPGQLEQVLVNLAVNARDAMPAGGTVRIETAHLELAQDDGGDHPGVAAGPWVRLAVSDTGTGLSEEAQRHLFEPFFTTKEKGKGTGLGLATCYGIVKQMGGHIWLRSAAGSGTTVEILLPRADGPVERAAAVSDSATAAPRGHERLLVVEDEPQVRALAARALAERGYEVLTAGDGEEALQLLARQERPIALLLTDVIMPRMGGVELASRLAEGRPALPILFMSGYVDRGAAAQGALPDGAPVILKPFTPSSLATRVREALDAPRPRP